MGSILMRKPGLCLMGMVLSVILASTTASLAQIVDLAGTLEARAAAPATVIVWNRPAVVLRAAIGGVSPEERAERIRRRIEELPLEGAEVRAEPASFRGLEGIAILVGDRILFGLVPQDLDPESSESLEEAARSAVLRIQEIIAARAKAHRPDVILKGLAYSAGSLLLLVLFVRGVLRVRRGSERLHPPHYLQELRIYGFDVTPVVSYLGRNAVHIVSAAFVLLAVYLFVAFALSQFPYTRPWGEGLGRFLLDHLFELARGALGAVPGFFTVAIIFVAGRFISRAVSGFFERVEKGQAVLPGLDPDTARATMRIVVVLIWIFVLTAAYPYIPASRTEAFKAISVFVGLMASLGGVGFVNQVMSGLVVVYSRSIRIGDYVRIGDKEGIVSDIGALSTKIVTPARHEITVPNGVLAGSTITNYTKLAGEDGAVIQTSVTIGYDAPSLTEVDARKATPPPRFEVKAPEGAPNVVIVLIDDIGFGHSSAFGGPIRMPTLEKLASRGLRYNRFHTTALCSPTRTALLTGRNHHVNNAGAIMELATAFPGNTGVRPASVTPLAEILRLNGYSTAAFGKYHETAPWEASVSGPYDRWPTRSGFDKFYGFIGGETNQWAPAIYDGVARVEPPHDPNYHFTTDMTNQAMAWVRFQQALTPDKPFYMYFATGATHAPHHVPKEWIAKYKGEFDQGWDKLREETLARQLEMGVVPAGTKLTARPAEIPAWDSLTADQKRLFARQMETFAGFAEHTDHEAGRLVQALKDMGEMENTLFLYIVGDNGSSAEGGPDGTYNEMLALNGIISDVSSQLARVDEWGGPNTFPHFSIGWAHAGNTPFQWTKQVASHFGGTRNPMVVHWPARIQNAHGEVRSQFHHVIDVAPTVLEAAGLPQPTLVNGARQYPMDGTSMVYTFDDPGAAGRRTTQYFEMFGNRAIYHDGWVAATRHSIPWLMAELPTFDQDRWELYNVAEDFSQADDLAAENPEKLKELQDLFAQEAIRNHVFPLDDRRVERFNAAIAGRPDLMGPRTSLTLYEGMKGITENTFINIKGKSIAITADIDVPASANGVIIAQAGRFGGWSLYMKDGRVRHVYNFGGLERSTVTSPAALTPGTHTVAYEFAYDGGKPGSGGVSRLTIDGKGAGEVRVPRTMPFLYSADEGVDVGVDNETPVTDDYEQGRNEFTGRIVKVTVEAK